MDNTYIRAKSLYILVRICNILLKIAISDSKIWSCYLIKLKLPIWSSSFGSSLQCKHKVYLELVTYFMLENLIPWSLAFSFVGYLSDKTSRECNIRWRETRKSKSCYYLHTRGRLADNWYEPSIYQKCLSLSNNFISL